VTYGGQYLLITPNTDCKNNAVYYMDIMKWEEDGKKPLPQFLPIIETPDAEYHVKLFIKSNQIKCCVGFKKFCTYNDYAFF